MNLLIKPLQVGMMIMLTGKKVNDNNDPNSYNWNYYDSIYSAPPVYRDLGYDTIFKQQRYYRYYASPDGAASLDG
jgi:hypothetical protein